MRRFSARTHRRGDVEFETTPPAHHAADAGVDLVWRGYVANRSEVRDALRASPEADDGDLLVAAYRRWGARFPVHVAGEYAVVLYDRHRRQTVLAHDELGLVPLFYSASNDGLHTGSHLADVAGACEAGELDEEFLGDYLAEGWHFGSRTPFARIRRLRPGETMVYGDGSSSFVDTWTLPDVREERRRDPREYEERLRELVSDGVTAAMYGHETPWCELSGGLDSSTVFTMAGRARPNTVHAVSFVYPRSRSADERTWMEAVLHETAAPWHAIDADALPPFAELPREPYAEPNHGSLTAARIRGYYDLLRRERAGVVLTGIGGDAVFLGDAPQPYYCADLLRDLRIRALADELTRWARASDERRSLGHWFALTALRPALRHARHRSVDYEHKRVPWLSGAFERRCGLRRRRGASIAPRMGSVASEWFLERVVRSAHAVSMRYVERDVPCDFRHPLLYRPLVAFMMSVPWDLKLHPECDRLLQRRAFEQILPQRIVLRRDKRGPDEWFYAGLERSSGWYDRLTADTRLAQSGYIDALAWEEAVRRARAGATIGIRYFLATATAELWLQARQDTRRRPANRGWS